MDLSAPTAAAVPGPPGSRWMPTATSIWSAKPRPASCRPPPASFSPPALLWTALEPMCRLAAASLPSSIRSLPPVESSLAYATYLGGQTGTPGDYISGIAIDSSSNAYIVGYTNSKDFPVTSGAYWTVCGTGGRDLRGGPRDQTQSYRHRHPLVHLCGRRQERWKRRLILHRTHPVGWQGEHLYHGASPDEFSHGQSRRARPQPGGAMEVAVAELDPTGANLLFSTRIGSGGRETANPAGLAVDSAGDIYLAGNILGPDLITTPGAFQTTDPSPVPRAATTASWQRSQRRPRISRRFSTLRAPNRAFPPAPGFPSSARTWHIPRGCGRTAKFSAASCLRCWMESA